VGVVLLVSGAVTLIALMLPAGGILNRLVADVLRPAFGQGAWLLPLVLLVAGVLVERAPRVGNGWGVTALGGLVAFVGALGLIHLVWGRGGGGAALRAGGGWIGYQLGAVLSHWISPAGAFVVLLGLLITGVLLLFSLTVRGLVAPVARAGHGLAGVLATPVRPDDEQRRGARESASAPAAVGPGKASLPRGGRQREAAVEEADVPAPEPNPLPLSQTVWAGSRDRPSAALGSTATPSGESGVGGATAGVTGASASPGGMPVTAVSARAVAGTPAAVAGVRADAPEGGQTGLDAPLGGTAAAAGAVAADGSAPASAGLLTAEEAGPALHERSWVLPSPELLDQQRTSQVGGRLDHERNVRIIEEKLRSFQIPATVTGTNTGPVVTQYEVRPDARVKLSRIEALADDLAMALAARSIRIEAPIPGKDVVGIEVPNHASEIVSFRGLIEDANMLDATSKLTFALGRDVSGKAYAVDLAKMPHLLIAGATGSGKSVCVNALITSLLMRARPDEVRLVLVDLKRVELAAYEGLPHLLTDVIVEAGDARAALHWAVAQMEDRYRGLAAKAERNIAAYNTSPRVAEHERLPYIVVVVDELADLMMREGRKVEDPIVKLAQKARAVGIHLVLATQRPSVNVVTGLIKANVPSRIAFAMASQIDSRTVLDAPGAEDLIGRGDMLYQPADLPRPVRLQGVFVSDREVRAITDHWRAQAPEPDYDPEVIAWTDGDGGGGGQFGWLAQAAEDEMTARAAELVAQTGKASTSMLQTKLKVGFNRASRLIDELERFGVVGPQDPRNPAVPRQIYGPDNWLRSPNGHED
jgi:S-DNA-T family DNA segregation ATPase FtsK/SpoIIIE